MCFFVILSGWRRPALSQTIIVMSQCFRKAFLVFVVMLCVPFARLLAGNVIKPELFEKNIIVLDPADPLPRGATELQDVEVNGRAAGLGFSYLDMMQTLKKKALEHNANIIKITEKVIGD